MPLREKKREEYLKATFNKKVTGYRIYHSDSVTSVAFSPDGKYALSGSRDMTLKLWDVFAGLEIRTFKGHFGFIIAVAFSHNGHYIMSGSDDATIKVWDISSGKVVKTLIGHLGDVNSVAFSPDDEHALSSGADGSIRIWSISTGDEIARMIGFEDGEWSIVTKDGYYCTSDKYSQNNETFYQPEMVKRTLTDLMQKVN